MGEGVLNYPASGLRALGTCCSCFSFLRDTACAASSLTTCVEQLRRPARVTERGASCASSATIARGARGRRKPEAGCAGKNDMLRAPKTTLRWGNGVSMSVRHPPRCRTHKQQNPSRPPTRGGPRKHVEHAAPLARVGLRQHAFADGAWARPPAPRPRAPAPHTHTRARDQPRERATRAWPGTLARQKPHNTHRPNGWRPSGVPRHEPPHPIVGAPARPPGLSATR